MTEISGLSKLPQRRSIRLKQYDYSLAGAYFVTACVSRGLSLGVIRNAEMHLNAQGNLVAWVWWEIPFLYPGIEQDAFIIMPNHVHGIIVLHGHPADYISGSANKETVDPASEVGAGPRP